MGRCFSNSVHEKLAKIGATCIAEFAASDMDGGQVDMQLAHWSLSSLIAIFQQADIPLPASLSDQLYEKVTPLETFVWMAEHPRTPPPLSRMPLLT